MKNIEIPRGEGLLDTVCVEKGTLYIYGNSGEGQNVAAMALNSKRNVVFINDYTQACDFLRIRTVSFEEAMQSAKLEADVFAVAIGEPELREELYEKILSHGGTMALPIVYPGFPGSVGLRIGRGTVIHYGALLQPNVKIGENCLINMNVVVGHDVRVLHHTVLSTGVIVGGFTTIGERTYVGSGAVLRDRIHIGNDCIIGMGAVVTKDVPDNQVVVGNPARVVRENVSKRVFKK